VTRILWGFGWAGVLAWSLVAALAYWFLDGATSLAMRHADLLSTDPDTVEVLFGLFGSLRALSTSAILVVWGVVSLAILSVPWLFDRLLGRASRPPEGRPRVRPDGVIDLAPSEYSAAPSSIRPSRTVPGVAPRGIAPRGTAPGP